MTQQVEQIIGRWRRFRPKSLFFHGPMPLIPLINVAFVIMLFMVLDFAFVLQPGVVVQLPPADFVSGAHYGSMVVTLTQEGRVFFNDEWMPMEDLAFAFSQAAHRNQNLSLIIEADASVPYGMVVRVMSIAAAARIRQVDLATRPTFGEKLSHESLDRK